MEFQPVFPSQSWQQAWPAQHCASVGAEGCHTWQVALIKCEPRAEECFGLRTWPAAEPESPRYRLATFTLPDANGMHFAMDELAHSQVAAHALIVDAELICSQSLAALRRYRQHRPQLPWLLAWHAPTAENYEVAIELRFQGALAWSSSREQLERALDAVRAGEFWFPRRVLQALYVAALGAQPHSDTAGREEHAAPGLTAREAQVLVHLRHGDSNKQIANDLHISLNTVKKHLAHVYAKLGVHNARQATA